MPHDNFTNDVNNYTVDLRPESHVFHPMLPVRVHTGDPRRSILTYCFLDNGSSGCFVTDELKEELEADGPSSWLKIKTLNGASHESCTVLSDLTLTDMDGNNPVLLPKVFTRHTIPMEHDHLAHRDRKLPELEEFLDLLPPHFPDVRVGLLVGCNSPLLEPLEVRHCQPQTALYAVRYRHGWAVQGANTNAESQEHLTCHRTAIQEVFSAPRVMSILESDFQDVKTITGPEDKGYSAEDKLFLEIVERGARFTDGKYEVPMPFRSLPPRLPNNRTQALMRLQWQTKKMSKNPAYQKDYTDFMQTLIDKGYCEPVDDHDDNDPEAWYLPHHGIYHPKILNSRPITPLSSDPNDLDALTPQQLLTLKTDESLVANQFLGSEALYARKRWRQVQHLCDVFWDRWRKEFLREMQPRSKWHVPQRNMRVGDIVLLSDANSPRGKWPLARVIEAKVSADGLVRSVILKTKSGELRRPIHKCILILPVEEV
jgi:hypothetical protein